jgi:hypothetical protein
MSPLVGALAASYCAAAVAMGAISYRDDIETFALTMEAYGIELKSQPVFVRFVFFLMFLVSQLLLCLLLWPFRAARMAGATLPRWSEPVTISRPDVGSRFDKDGHCVSCGLSSDWGVLAMTIDDIERLRGEALPTTHLARYEEATEAPELDVITEVLQVPCPYCGADAGDQCTIEVCDPS